MTLDSFLPQLQLYPTGKLREQDQQQSRRIDAALPPGDPAAPDRGVENCKMLIRHGWLQICPMSELDAGLESRLGNSCDPPDSGRFLGCPRENGGTKPAIRRHRA